VEAEIVQWLISREFSQQERENVHGLPGVNIALFGEVGIRVSMLQNNRVDFSMSHLVTDRENVFLLERWNLRIFH
jgi:hypothetical protein